MFCLRSWLPLLFIPTNASPLFIISFVALTYVLHRPCIYCSALLLILFISSCNWADRCFFDLRGDWFSPRFVSDAMSSPSSTSAFSGPNDTLAEYVAQTVSTTAKALAGAMVDGAQRGFALNGTSSGMVQDQDFQQEEWAGIGLEWLRSLLGRREWTLPCVDVKVRL